jgi:drug/metabolite transporter (DMT)-like permease
MNKRIVFSGLILISMIFWGINWTAGKILTSWATPRVLAFWRYAITLVILIPPYVINLRQNKKNRITDPKDWLLIILSGILLALFNFLFFKGLEKGSASVGGIFFNTLNPVITMGASILLFRKKVAAMKIAGILVGLAGGILLIAAQGSTSDQLLKNGNLYFLGAAFSWSAITLASRRVQQKVPFFSYSFYVYTIAALIHLIPAAQEGLNIFTIKSMEFWLVLGFTAIGATAFANTMFFYATSKLSAYQASSFMFIIPVSAFAAAAIFLGETLSPAQYAGGALSLAALLIISFGGLGKGK